MRNLWMVLVCLLGFLSGEFARAALAAPISLPYDRAVRTMMLHNCLDSTTEGFDGSAPN